MHEGYQGTVLWQRALAHFFCVLSGKENTSIFFTIRCSFKTQLIDKLEHVCNGKLGSHQVPRGTTSARCIHQSILNTDQLASNVDASEKLARFAWLIYGFQKPSSQKLHQRISCTNLKAHLIGSCGKKTIVVVSSVNSSRSCSM